MRKNILFISICLAFASLNVNAQKKTRNATPKAPATFAEMVSNFKLQNSKLDSVSESQYKEQISAIVNAYPAESTYLSKQFRNFYSTLLTKGNIDAERTAVEKLAAKLDKSDFFKKELKQINDNASLNDIEKSRAMLEVAQQIVATLELQTQLEWLNILNIESAFNDMSKQKGFDVAQNRQKLDELKSLVGKGFNGIYNGDKNAAANATRALDLKRQILLANPALDMDKLLTGRYQIGSNARSVGAPSLGTQANNWSGQTSASQSGFNAEIVELSNLRGEKPSQRLIYKPDTKTSLPDLQLHWDADKFLFSMVEKDDHHWQVFEIGTDGNNLKQLTNQMGEDLDFSDGCYLPNGKIMAVSNVGVHGVPCVSGSDQVGNMCLIDPSKNEMRRLTFDQDNNWGPVVMHNGRVMFVRWEYTDLTHYFSRIVMHMNPDGTEQRSLYGSGSVFPTSIYDVQPLPDHSTRFVGIISGHHGVARSGRLIIFDPAISRKEEKGMVQEMPFSKRPIIPIVKDEMVNDVWPQFLKPQPLTNDYFITTAKLTPNGLWGLYLVDIFDNLTLIAEYENEGLIYGIPMVKRNMPPVIPEKVKEDTKEATVFIQDIYEGEGLQGVPRGEVKELRVFAYEYAYLKTQSDHNAQGIQSGWDLKRLLGTVPVEEDGSVMFKIPANTPISLQPVDKDGAAIQWMRSWLTGMPGETVSCVGCHEDQNSIPMPKRAMASMKKPQILTAPKGGVHSINFDMDLQPILDRNCVSCHNENSPINFVGGKKDSRGYGTSYLAFHPYVHRQGPEAGMKVLYPYEYHPSTSRIVQLLKKGHYDVKLTDEEWRKLYNWIDFNAPDKGYFDHNTSVGRHEFDQYERRIRLNDNFANGSGARWRQELADYANFLKEEGAPEPVKPNYKEPQYKEAKAKGFPFVAQGELEKKVVNIAPGMDITLVRIPAGKYVMGKNMKNSDAAPAIVVDIKKPFWMSEKEITNAQFNVFFPEHDSRYVDQQWKDHVNEGYPANLPGQPVTRISHNDAAAFCQALAKTSGLAVMLPTEEQWEWACRAGTDSDFWYGDLNTDFGKFENMSDSQMNKMAVTGVNPQPINSKNPWYKYYTHHPKQEHVDDGHMIMTDPGSYQANPFGLYDMHGNVAEWTRSDYVPYSAKKKKDSTSDRKVVRGGSWIDHPKYATSYIRQAYLPFQKVYNVGFRIIIED